MKYNILIPKIPGPTVLYENKKDKILAEKMMNAYSKGGSEEDKKLLQKYKI